MDRMPRPIVAASTLFAALAASPAVAGDYLDGALHVGGFVRLSGAYHYGPLNPNNTAVQTENNEWNQMRLWAQLNFEYTPQDQELFSLFWKVNYAGSFVADLDSAIGDFEAFPSFPDDLATEDDQHQLRLWEVYADIRPGRWWFRIGRQTTAWGDTIAFRTTDIVNPLDLTWHPVGEPWFEEFRYQREPQWMARAVYNIPSRGVPDLEIEGLYSPDFIPLKLPQGGSPYSIIPFGTAEGLPFTTPGGVPFLQITDDDPRGDEWGLRLKGTFGRWALAWMFYSGFNDAPVNQTRGIRFDPAGVDFGFGPFVIEVDGLHPRVDNFMITANRYVQSADFVFNFEARYAPDQAYEHTDFAAGLNPGDLPFVRRETLVYSLGFDKNIHLPALNYGRSFNMGFQVQHTKILETDDLANVTMAGTPVEEDTFLLNYTVRTGYDNDNIQPFFLILYDPEGAWWFSPYVQISRGNHWRYWVGLNEFVSNDSTQFDTARSFPLGVFDHQDELFFRVSYEF